MNTPTRTPGRATWKGTEEPRQPGPEAPGPEGRPPHLGEPAACKPLSSFKHFPSPDTEQEAKQPGTERLPEVEQLAEMLSCLEAGRDKMRSQFAEAAWA